MQGNLWRAERDCLEKRLGAARGNYGVLARSIPQADVCLSLTVQVRNSQTALILGETPRNVGTGTNGRGRCEVSVGEYEQEDVYIR